MWERDTLHNCASELQQLSDRFKWLYLDERERTARLPELREASQEGVKLLRMLALAVRSEQDSGVLPDSREIVGALKASATLEEVRRTLSSYRPPFESLTGFSPLRLRQGLNKIAHVDVGTTGFAVDADHHELLLSGTNREVRWLAVLSIPHFCSAVRALPDRPMPNA